MDRLGYICMHLFFFIIVYGNVAQETDFSVCLDFLFLPVYIFYNTVVL